MKLFYVIGLLLASLLVSAQTNDFGKGIEKTQAFNESLDFFDLSFGQHTEQVEIMKTTSQIRYV